MAVKKVIIVGGGITGSVLALDLQRRGITPLLLEISPTWEALGHGITIQGNLLRALERVGVADAIIRGSFAYDSFNTRSADGTLIEAIVEPPLGGPELPPSVGPCGRSSRASSVPRWSRRAWRCGSARRSCR